jgi:hypothetical protein
MAELKARRPEKITRDFECGSSKPRAKGLTNREQRPASREKTPDRRAKSNECGGFFFAGVGWKVKRVLRLEANMKKGFFFAGVSSLCLLLPSMSMAEKVMVKYRGVVDLDPFACEWTPKSSVVGRLCYDPAEGYVLVNLKGTYYHYCEVPSAVYKSWRESSSLGGFYNQNIKGRYDCRVNRMPNYGNKK